MSGENILAMSAGGASARTVATERSSAMAKVHRVKLLLYLLMVDKLIRLLRTHATEKCFLRGKIRIQL